MSTKTSFKRVALVAVAALGFGVLSSVSASATPTALTATNGNMSQYITGITLAQVTSAPTVGSSVVVNFGAGIGAGDTFTGTSGTALINKFVGVLSSVPTNGGAQVIGSKYASGTTTGFTGFTGDTATSANYISFESATIGNSPVATSVTATTLVGAGSFSFTPTKVGTYSLTVYNQAGDGGNLNAKDDGEMFSMISITVGAASAYSAGQSTSVSTGPATTGFTTTDSTTAQKTVSKVIATTNAGTIAVTLKNADASASYSNVVSAVVTGPGLITTDTTITAGAGAARSSSVTLTSAQNVAYIHVSADGSSGVGSIAITVTDAAGVSSLLATETYTFVGSVTAFTRDADTGKTNIGVGETDTIDLLPVDSLGNTAAIMTTLVATSSNTLVATVVANADNTILVTGVASGTAVITACDVACATTTAISATFTVTVTKKTAASYTLTFDKASYAPGEKMTLTLDAKDSNGASVADSSNGQSPETSFTRALFSSTGLTANAAITGLPAASSAVTIASGKATWTMYAPLISGDVVISATEGTGVDSVALLASSAKVITATATVTGGSADAALDAANEATDAAYAAADAADNATQAAVDAGAAAALAQESADAALAAVTDLGIKVTGLLDALSKSLANIYKIIKAIQAKK